MNYVQKFKEKLNNYKPPEQEQKPEPPQLVSPRIVELAGNIKMWHDTRPCPERWQEISLGRIAAHFNVSREVAAAALQYAGWVEKRVSASSVWQPKEY